MRKRRKAIENGAIVNVDLLPGLAVSVDWKVLGRVMERVLALEGILEGVQVDVTITDDEHIRNLNATHRGINQTTDVLSFPLSSKQGETLPDFVLPPNQARSLGDVVISYERAVEQAQEYGHSVEREMGYLLVHGILHLLGYDHETEAEQKVMRDKEEEALADLPRAG